MTNALSVLEPQQQQPTSETGIIVQQLDDRLKDPTLVLKQGGRQAQALMAVVRQQGLSTKFAGNDQEFLQVEAWMLICEFNGASAIPSVPCEIRNEQGTVTGYTVVTELRDSFDRLIGRGNGSCLLTEPPCLMRDGSRKANADQAARSMAETRSISRACSNRWRYVAKLGGYAGTPSEDMVADASDILDDEAAADVAPFGICPDHNKPFVHKQGVSPKNGKAYDWWTCSEKKGKNYCDWNADKWLKDELKKRDLKSFGELAARLNVYLAEPPSKDTVLAALKSEGFATHRDILGALDLLKDAEAGETKEDTADADGAAVASAEEQETVGDEVTL